MNTAHGAAPVLDGAFNIAPLTDSQFSEFQKMIFDIAGIHMSDAKKALIAGRLLKRLRHYHFHSYGEYLELVSHETGNEEERQVLVNQLTTNETYFFRESKHFDFLRDTVLPHWKGGKFRVWSAASSSGEEAYTISMILAENFGYGGWEIFGSDINEEVLADAVNAVYPLEDSENIPEPFLKKYCLKGVRSMEGFFTINHELRNNVSFGKINLNTDLPPDLGKFQIIFLRNVMIYFNREKKAEIVNRIIEHLTPDGYLIVGHAESLHGITDRVKAKAPTIYQKI